MWEKIRGFLKDVRGEFSRVSWPTREDLFNSTSVVLLFSAVFAVFIGVFDLAISFLWGMLLSR